MLQILHKTNINFMGWKNVSFAVSAIMISLGLLALVQISRGKANMGIDFVGGTTVQLSFKDRLPIDEARTALDNAGYQGFTLQDFSDGNKILIRLREHEGVAEKVVETFKQAFPAKPFEVEATTEIGPTIGADLQKDALLAVIFSVIAIIIYIAIRFEFKFGVAAAIATIHDVFAVLAVFWLLNKEINLLIVTALLTLAGYSLTDTVVVFDRIRENLKKAKREPLAQLINTSVNEVLSRTIVTSLTVVLVLVPLVMFGGEVLHDFSLSLLLGVIIGTYSSVFVASPILAVWHEKAGGQLIKKR